MSINARTSKGDGTPIMVRVVAVVGGQLVKKVRVRAWNEDA